MTGPAAQKRAQNVKTRIEEYGPARPSMRRAISRGSGHMIYTLSDHTADGWVAARRQHSSKHKQRCCRREMNVAVIT